MPDLKFNSGESDEPPKQPDLTRITRWIRGPLGMVAVAVTGLFILAVFYTLDVAQSLIMPIVIALLLNFLLSPVVRFFERHRIPAPLGAAIVLIGLVGIMFTGVYNLVGPAAEWLENAPDKFTEAEYKLRGIKESLEKVEKATEEIDKLTGNGENAPQQVEVKEPAFSEQLVVQTRKLIAGGVILFFLLYFLLASSDQFLRKLVKVLPVLNHKKNAILIIRNTENDLSRYFLTVTIINSFLGLAVAIALFLFGIPNPLLWGVMVAILNFIPYLGGLVGVSVIAIVSILTFDSVGYAVLPPLVYLLLNTIEGNLVTPLILGRSLRLNPVAVFISIFFWGWIWGIPGAILAVPILVSLKIVADNVTTLEAIGEFLGR